MMGHKFLQERQDLCQTIVCIIGLFLTLDVVQSSQARGHPHPKEQTRTEFLKDLLANYDSNIKPYFDEEQTTIVVVNIYVQSFDSIDESRMDYRVTIYLRQEWYDDRLQFNASWANSSEISLDSKMSTSLWVPDLFLSNEKKATFHDVTVPNKLTRIRSDGKVLYSMRISAQLSCHMNLRRFPFDTQLCTMDLESYSYTVRDVELVWMDNTPVQSKPDLTIAQFQLVKIEVSNGTKSYMTGNFTFIQVVFKLKRNVAFYFIQNYIPTILVVGLSWVSFWISIDAVPARITLGVLTILTITTQTTGLRNSLPRVSYVKAIDVWTSFCLAFVYCGLLEYVFINVVSRRRSISKIASRFMRKNLDIEAVNGMLVKQGANSLLTEEADRDNSERSKLYARRIDKVARIVFPCFFLIFNVAYWAVYYVPYIEKP